MTDKKTVALIFGGYSNEYEVSLSSAHAIIKAIDLVKYFPVLIGITRAGTWYRYIGDVDKIANDTWHEDKANLIPAVISPSRGEGLIEFFTSTTKTTKIDAVFPVLHGKNGEDGTVQGLCELAGIPIVGSTTASSAFCMDKVRAYHLVAHAGISVPKFVYYDVMPTEKKVGTDISHMTLPLFVKPSKAGSSVGVSKVDDFADVKEAIKAAFEHDDVVLVEEGIAGLELGCAVVGNNELFTGRIDEIDAPSGFFDYVEKYSLKTAKIHTPARIDTSSELRLQETAKSIFKVLGCRGYARIDMFLKDSGEIVFSEANTIPGFTSHSRFPRMMREAGMSFSDLIGKLIELAYETSNN